MKVLDYFKSKKPKTAEQKGAADTVSLSDRKAMAMAAAASEKPVQVEDGLKADVKRQLASIKNTLNEAEAGMGNTPLSAGKPDSSGDDSRAAYRQNQNNQTVVQNPGSPTDDRAGITLPDAKARGVAKEPKAEQGKAVSGPSAPLNTPTTPSMGGRRGRAH